MHHPQDVQQHQPRRAPWMRPGRSPVSSHWTLASMLLGLILLLSVVGAHVGVQAAPVVLKNGMAARAPQPQPAARIPQEVERAMRVAARVQPSAVPLQPRVTQAPEARNVGSQRKEDLDAVLRWYEERGKRLPTAVRRDEQPSVPLSQLGPPSFPAQYPSCVKCEAKYSSLSSCMEASAVFQNATSIFNNPLSYIAVVKCACTDTFQAVYPQCLDCFQHTNQCWYLGTDPQGTGAPEIISNIRNICGFGSALLGGVASANGMNGTGTTTVRPSVIGTYTDVGATDYRPGYNDQSTGPIFGSASRQEVPAALLSVGMAAVLGSAILTLSL